MGNRTHSPPLSDVCAYPVQPSVLLQSAQQSARATTTITITLKPDSSWGKSSFFKPEHSSSGASKTTISNQPQQECLQNLRSWSEGFSPSGFIFKLRPTDKFSKLRKWDCELVLTFWRRIFLTGDNSRKTQTQDQNCSLHFDSSFKKETKICVCYFACSFFVKQECTVPYLYCSVTSSE